VSGAKTIIRLIEAAWQIHHVSTGKYEGVVCPHDNAAYYTTSWCDDCAAEPFDALRDALEDAETLICDRCGGSGTEPGNEVTQMGCRLCNESGVASGKGLKP
tara:strand:- start:593 stop:898 length:306 start_codon:yes stop_codon:yes gene_type:complete